MSFPTTELICWIVQSRICLFWKYMDGAVFSCDVQQIKPEVDIYKTLLKRYSLKPEKSVFLDDRAVNCEGAGRAGIHTIQFENLKQAAKELEKLGEMTFSVKRNAEDLHHREALCILKGRI